MSAVTRQPQGEAERLQAGQALLACPTNSIGCQPQDKALMNATLASFPIPISHEALGPGVVSYLGFASPNSFGAASYFIQRPQGNVIIDSPRINGPLGKKLDSLGGARWMLLTHRDDVADHNEWGDRFGCARVLHLDEIDARTRNVEVKPEGSEVHKVDEDLLYIPVPGHTKGHSVILYDNKYLFTGDHLEYDEDAHALRAFKDYCWYDWETQIESMKKLLAYDFEWVLPGHGRRWHAPKDKMKEALKECINWMVSV